jgi:ferrochelatase
MARFQGEKNYLHGSPESTGILLINLGTPDEPTTKALRRYLAEFLSDRRVVEIPQLVWLFILYAFILPRRPAKSAALYKSIWRKEGSPLLAFSRQQQEALKKEMQIRFKGPVVVELAMRYGQPSIQQGLENLKKQGAHRILVFPLYPQYSATTTASCFDKVSDILQNWRWIPELRFIGQYHDHTAYIDALAKSVQQHWKENERGELLLMSFHGIPKRNLLLGDPYHCQCHKTGRLLAERLGLKDNQWRVSFQSRFGKAEWLQPYTDKTLEGLPAENIKSVDVICPGFSVDCLETLEEIAVENRDVFLQAGGEKYTYIPALNANNEHIHALADLIQQHTQGWPETNPEWDKLEQEKQAAQTIQQAREKGAKQ